MRKFIPLITVSVLLSAFFACTKVKDFAGGNVEISPSSIEVPCGLSTATIEVKADCNWSIGFTDDSGAGVSWIVPDKSSGNGNAVITLKVYANKFRHSRSCTITVTSSEGTAASSVLSQEGDPDSDSDGSSVTVRVGTFNLRMSNLDNGDNAWDKRKNRVAQAVRKNDFGFFGVQECDTRIQKDLPALVGDIYECKFFSPYSQTGNGDKAQGLLYKKNEYRLSDWNFFWPSEDPDRMSINDTGSEGNYTRGACCGILTHIQTGIRIFVMVSHACLNDGSNNKWAPVYAEMEKRFNPDGLPSIFVGDMNAKPGDNPSVEYRKHWKDTYLELPQSSISGPSGTYNGFNLNVNLNKASRLDYIYFRGDVTPLKYVADDSRYEGFFPSDHIPVYAEMTIRY